MIALECHPDSRSEAVRRVAVRAKRSGDVLSLAYLIEGQIDRLRLPPPGLLPLWQHTCCELFIARPEVPAYHEFNFSPSGDWAAYAFTDYRQGAPLDAPDPGIVVSLSAAQVALQAAVRTPPRVLLLGLCAVIEERGGMLSYWALRHAPGKPDFHRRDAFALELA